MCTRADAQITIGGSIYGGGNQGNTGGKTAVTVYAGNLHQVYGGARMADIGGSAFVHIDGKNAVDGSYIIIDKVYGGNDISGNIGTSATIPDSLTQAVANGINNEWNVFVRTSNGANNKIYIGQLFGGGNGEYNYAYNAETGVHSIIDKKTSEVLATSEDDFYVPDVARTYLELLGASVDYIYGGGNNATITDSTVICFDNPSTVVTSIVDENDVELITADRCRDKMGLNLAFSHPESPDFQVGCLFGGNNFAEMKITPKWILNQGKVRNLYSGGNHGDMTSPLGLMLEIPDTSTIIVDNIYGGCRMADVMPTVNGVYTPADNLPGYKFPKGLSARVLVRGGDINNVYGGNDITGRVYGGSAVGIYTSVSGDVYGGGNGSYAYTDNPALADNETYGDFYYTVPDGKTSVEALNDFRPNAEQVSVRLYSPDHNKPTIIGGSVYCGGNSASLKTTKANPMVELKIGSYVIAENVFLGNNGRNMIRYNEAGKDEEGNTVTDAVEGVLRTMKGDGFSTIDLTDSLQFAAYMQGAAMPLVPSVVFDSKAKGDPDDYEPFTTYVGSFFLGGNVGSMTAPGTFTMDELNSIIIYKKFVGGCNDAYVAATDYNAEHMGGVTEAPTAGNPKIRMDFEGLKLKPMKLNDAENGLVWNTNGKDGEARRLMGANVYGGCYNSGYVNGDILINLDQSTVDTTEVFGAGASGVDPTIQRDELLFTSMGIFGGGYGENSEVWGSTTINVKDGYHFNVYGGGEKGAIGKKVAGSYSYDADYSTHVNLVGSVKGAATGAMTEAEYLYGGGFEGLVAGDTHVTLGNGRVNSTFGGAANADILGHAETIIGSGGFPYVIDDVYGGNDLGGNILGSADFTEKVRSDIRSKMFNGGSAATASSYVEYLQGHVGEIFGGAYGGYNYERIPEETKVRAHLLNNDTTKVVDKPYLPNAFVHIRPDRNNDSKVDAVYGAGLGSEGSSDSAAKAHIGDMMQDRSYVLIDIPDAYDKLRSLKVFGAGSFNGLGMGITRSASDEDPKLATAVIDLMAGEVDAVYGASYHEGITRRTLVNVPDGSTFVTNSIFGGAYGTRSDNDRPCDAFEANVNYASNDAIVRHAIYGGNNNARRTLYGKVNVSSNVWSNKEKGYQATVYGAGYGRDTWSQYTEVNLENGANVYEAYGGGEMGMVINKETVAKWKTTKTNLYVDLPEGYTDNGLTDNLALGNKLHERESSRPEKYNTNVHIKQGAYVGGYCYGGGLGYNDVANSGNVYGTTYIDLLGGTVKKDLYAAGTTGSVKDSLDIGDGFIASATAYIEGGTVRNVYGGGWKGSVGHHDGGIDATTEGDILGETHVIIGIRKDQATPPTGYGYNVGVPAVQRNVYGGGEGGAVYGTSHVTLNNGYIGYVYSTTEPTAPDGITENPPYEESPYESGTYYQEKIHDETWTDHVGENRLYGSGNVFGGGYIDNSSVDYTNIIMWNGKVRNSLFGGGEIAAIGRGAVEVTGYQNSERTLLGKYKLGKTHIEMYNGHVLRDVFAGGKGYDNLGRVGTLYTDGYVFGQTEAFIRGGEIGTATNYTEGYGNVFGGGDLGYVYGKGEKCEDADYRPSPNHYYYTEDGTKVGDKWTEDCKVVVEATAQVKAGQTVTIGSNTYTQYQYVPLEDLNKLKGKNDANDGAKWNALDDKGIIIHNAVFGGGNVADGSDKVYANTKTVFGNVTASLRDVYRRDLITIGTEHTGGLYGGGNLSLVDGYRELHISNYGTDYYNLQSTVTKEQYDNNLTDRERAYFRLRYTCRQNVPSRTIDGVTYRGYNEGQQIYEDEYKELYSDYQNSTYWTEDGVCSIYSGRLLNTLQRADLVGVFGSRMVLQGAHDRVTEVQDNTNYTINRVGELSLKKVVSPAGETDELNKEHGNYFGIYSVVNYLGNLTSDVLMTDTRETDSGDGTPVMTYHDWKAANPNSRKRNTATCHNQVALASGVFLELVNEPTGKVTKSGKEYGYITGVVELDLINAKADAIGGGYVYAKNEHGQREEVEYDRVRLSDFNRPKPGDTDGGLRTYKMYKYNESILEYIQTSGNFIHGKAKTIIDDCYPNNLEYDHTKADFSEAHYWYVKGSIYIYDQVISAYTGAPTAYSRSKHIPLTITAGSHGKLQLLDVKPNKYAYYNKSGVPLGSNEEVKVSNNSVTYKLNDVITYWDWSQLSKDEQDLFVDETWVCIADGTVGSTTYTKGEVFNSEPASPAPGTIIKDAEGNTCEFTDIIRPTNNISHDTGYVLDFKMDTPPAWSRWYSSKTGVDKIDSLTYIKPETVQANYVPGPTYSTVGGVYGQRNYSAGEIITEDVVTDYLTTGLAGGDGQAIVEPAYVAKEAVTYTYNDGVKEVSKSVSKGTAIPKTEYDALATQAPSAHAKFAAAKMCTSTLRLNDETYLVYGDLFTVDSINHLKSEFHTMETEIGNSFTDAYICSSKGLYGGKSYSSSEKYSALEGWASLTSDDRDKNEFTFNYDAFDVLIDPAYPGKSAYRAPYNEEQHVEYVAIYKGTTDLDVSYVDADKDGFADGLGTIKTDSLLTRLQYEALTNEKAYYTPIVVPANIVGSEDIHIVTNDDNGPVSLGSMVYTKGQIIPTSTYLALPPEDQAKVSKVTVSNSTSSAVTYYYCHTGYTGTHSVTNRKNGSGVIGSEATSEPSSDVIAGWVINHDDYSNLTNDQKDFVIKGNEPTETTTLYVSRESDIRDLSKDKVITVIYQYTYNESDDNGDVTPVNEMHIVNIHLDFESGAPIIDRLMAPTTVLPGTTVGMNQPRVTPGAYELIGGGWEIFDSKYNAEHHTNGQEYVNNSTPMYYYQDGYYVAYYAKSYLGKTYSNPVQFSVANYHDLKKVMDAKTHHYYIDHKDAHLPGKRIPKVYINDYTADGENGLDLLKDLYDLSLITSSTPGITVDGDSITSAGHKFKGHKLLNSSTVMGANDLDFILRTNLAVGSTPWTPIGSGEATCFGGNVHGDGHYVSGLDNSLFDKLCGNVYNLGAMGTFTTGGIANSGDGTAENCWIKTTGTPAGVKAIIGNPTNDSQIKNCYYPGNEAFDTGAAKRASKTAFYYGEVAYNLNRFYLQKRFNLNRGGQTAITDTAYVSSRYGNVDFIYADGVIPDEDDVRLNRTTGNYEPLYPDDYIFFGQTLNYGYVVGAEHQDVPSPLVKDGDYIETGLTGNRVLRAPAYFRSSVKSKAYFNPYAVFAKHKNGDENTLLHDGMTAIDFTGYNDVFDGSTGEAKAYVNGIDEKGNFFAPLLDAETALTNFKNFGLTKNLLAYTEAPNDATVAGKTGHAVSLALAEMRYAETDGTYGTVAPKDESQVMAHWVQRNAGELTYSATYDHFLVDRNDFYAPIGYKFDASSRMWHQRIPDTYAALNTGWESISLPFRVLSVGTQQKGELTHFYTGDEKGRVGHEYWLRKYTDIESADASTMKATFSSLAKGEGTDAYDKAYTNTFLWDYLHKNLDILDGETEGQNKYYKTAHEYKGYPLMQGATPYIIGFPGKEFYEFDLSGEWKAPKLPSGFERQVVTFASVMGATINASDADMTGVKQDNYTFKPNYLNEEIAAGSDIYVMKSDGSKYVKVPAEGNATPLLPFRAYFVRTSGPNSMNIIFSEAEEKPDVTPEQDDKPIITPKGEAETDADGGKITFTSGVGTITAKSTIDEPRVVLVYGVSGALVKAFDLKQNSSVTIHVPSGLVYAVRTVSGDYSSKLMVR
ncbi:MAG: hypothetical protein IKO82_00720 [Prevotella sp.]|nr:hypothetical protein [Prevotella sp.]